MRLRSSLAHGRSTLGQARYLTMLIPFACIAIAEGCTTLAKRNASVAITGIGEDLRARGARGRKALKMFEDMPDDVDGFEVSSGSSDRELLYAIWTRNEAGDLPADEAWSILFERHPSELRFLLLNAYEEQMQPSIPDVWTPSYFGKKVARILDGSEDLKPRVRDLVVTAWSSLFDEKASPTMEALLKRVELTVKRPPSDADGEEAHARLGRFAADVLKELHDKTRDGGLIGPRPKKASTDYGTLVKEGKGPPTKYQPGARYELGALVEHVKFGVGVVTGIEPNRVELLFKDGPRKLVS